MLGGSYQKAYKHQRGTVTTNGNSWRMNVVLFTVYNVKFVISKLSSSIDVTKYTFFPSRCYRLDSQPQYISPLH